MNDIKIELDNIYQIRSKNAISKMKEILIDDHVYDINKLQKIKKYENDKKIKELRINYETVSGTENIVKAIEKKMSEELTEFSCLKNDDPATIDELYFLNSIPKNSWSNEEIEELCGPIREEEITSILENEVDLDSSPGEDGITYRVIKLFWKYTAYRALYIKYLNYTKQIGGMGSGGNIGIMIIKNKNVQSIEYDKKRKLTKVNKDLNLGHGKVWTNRMKKIILPKVLPKIQFNCQDDVNIIDEVREIRSVSQYLLGN